MALAVAQARKITTFGTSITVNSAWTVSAGSLLVAATATYAGGPGQNHSVSGGNNGDFANIGYARYGALHYKANAVAGTESLTVSTPGGAYIVAIFHEVTGAATSPFVAGEVGAASLSATTNPVTPYVTNSVVDSIFFALDAADYSTYTVDSTGSTPTGWALKDATNSQESSGAYACLSVPYLIVSSSAATRHGWTTSNAAAGVVIAAFGSPSAPTAHPRSFAVIVG